MSSDKPAVSRRLAAIRSRFKNAARHPPGWNWLAVSRALAVPMDDVIDFLWQAYKPAGLRAVGYSYKTAARGWGLSDQQVHRA